MFLTVFLFQITTMDQDTGVPSTEPIQTLRKFRSDTLLMPDKKSQRKVSYLRPLIKGFQALLDAANDIGFGL